jgi:hypothetical protein
MAAPFLQNYMQSMSRPRCVLQVITSTGHQSRQAQYKKTDDFRKIRSLSPSLCPMAGQFVPNGASSVIS